MPVQPRTASKLTSDVRNCVRAARCGAGARRRSTRWRARPRCTKVAGARGALWLSRASKHA
eukprot:5595608-Amphidinium_carterae.1